MTHFDITFSPTVSQEQMTILEKELRGYKVDFMCQLADIQESIIAGTIILGLSFAEKSYFDAFLKELGKDTYGWLKAKIDLIKAKEKRATEIEYRICIGNVYFCDEPYELFDTRHERILYIVDTTYKLLQRERLDNVVSVELLYDEAKGDYIEARCFETTSRSVINGEIVTSPVRVILL